MDNLTVVIPYYNGDTQVLVKLLASIPSDIPVVIADDTSATMPVVKRDRTRVLRLPQRGYFAGAVNYGAAACATDFLIVNQDSIFTGTSTFDLIAEKRSTYAMLGEAVQSHPAWPWGYVHGTCMFIRRDAWQQVGEFNARWYPLWGTTCEWQARACRHGLAVLPLKPLPGYKHLRPNRARFGTSIRKALQKEPEKKDLLLRIPPMISVVVPCYNYGRFLPDLVNSLIGGETSLGRTEGQTFQGFEIVIVDDGSTDGTTCKVAQSLADPGKGIRVIVQDNGGTPCATNTGIRHAHGQYVTKLDADDMMKPERLERMLEAAEQHPDEFIYDNVQRFGHGKLVKTQLLPDFDPVRLLERNHVHSGILLRRAHWELVGGYPEQLRSGREDWGMNINLAYHGVCGHHIPEPLYLYRREGHNRTESNTGPKWHQKFLAQMREIFPDAYREGLMGCCGGKRKRVAAPKAPLRAAAPAPKKTLSQRVVAMESDLRTPAGMALLRYLGKNHSKQTYIGSVTRRHYIFSVSRNSNYVDARDVPAMLKMRDEQGKAIFRAVTQKAATEPVREIMPPKPKSVIKAEPEIVTLPVVETLAAKESMTEAEEAHAKDIDINDQIEDLRRISGVGFSLARRLIAAGFTSAAMLAHSEEEAVSQLTGLTLNKSTQFVERAKVLMGERPS